MSKMTSDPVSLKQWDGSARLLESCASDDLLAQLRDLRSALAWALVHAPVSVAAQTAARLQVVSEAINAIVSQNPEGSTTDDLRQRVAAGFADSKVVPLAGRSSKRRAR